jgi:hypothetical protein
MYRNSNDVFDMKKDSLHMLYNGTKILQQSSQSNPMLKFSLPSDGTLLAIVSFFNVLSWLCWICPQDWFFYNTSN